MEVLTPSIIAKRAVAFFLAAIFYTSSANAAEDWTAQDTALLTLSNTLLVIDLGQTLDIRNCEGCSETNAILGRHPRSHEIYRYFGAAIAANTFLALQLPPQWRRLGLAGVIGMEFAMTYHNAKVGLNVHF